jgi:uncharacterized protein
MRQLGFAFVLCALLPLSTTHAASFDCVKAATPVEKLICQDEQTSLLDEYLGRYYRAAREALGRGADCLRADQREWLKTVRNRCADTECLRRAYLERLALLDGLQPGATAIEDVELPAGPQLLWILAPAEDEIAAPRNTDARPVELRGRIVDEVETGDGFVLRDERNESVLVRALMFLEPEDAERLGAAAKEHAAEFLVRGFIQTNEGSSAIDESRCAYLYRLRSR